MADICFSNVYNTITTDFLRQGEINIKWILLIAYNIGIITKNYIRFTFICFTVTILDMNIFRAMKPDAVYQSVLDVPFEGLKEMGKTCLLLDFDNTLGIDRTERPGEYAFECIKKVRENGFTCCLVSNAKSSRSSNIAKELDIPCVTYAHKPRPDGVNRALKLMDTKADKAVLIGDQIFTDVMAGRFAGVYTIMVEKYDKKEVWYIVLKRGLEKIVRAIGKF